MDYLIPILIGATIPFMSSFIISKFSQFNDLRKMVSSGTDSVSLDCSSVKGFIESTRKSLIIIKTSVEVMINQKMYSPEKVQFSWSQTTGLPKNSKFVHIYHNMKWYKVPLTIRRGPLSGEISCIKDEMGLDVTSDILPFAGPNHDFFGWGITPRFFNMSKMTIIMDGDEYSFSGEDSIVFSSESLVDNISNREFSLPPDSPEQKKPLFVRRLFPEITGTCTGATGGIFCITGDVGISHSADTESPSPVDISESPLKKSMVFSQSSCMSSDRLVPNSEKE